MQRSIHRSLVLAVVVLAGSALAGGMFADRGDADSGSADAGLRTLSQVIAVVEDNFAGEVDSAALIESAIQGMLQTLDPHSNYLNRHSFTEMRDEQRGKFYGLGIQINKPGADKPLTIIAPIEGTPAFRAGLHAGDIIFKIEGRETTELSLHEAVSLLKGDRGTEVTITIHRPVEETFFDVTIVRDEIPTHSLRVAYMLEPGVGLIRIGNFTSTTSVELDEAVRDLRGQGMQRLILDLRSNPGGLLDQAVQVAERFVPRGELIVYTRGRVHGSDQDYVARNGAERVGIPLVVLVDRHSASASEIVAGAIQDHDLGLVVGETTFGKGLVQRVIPLRNGAAVALTTAKYYTPSGRLIQRDYHDRDGYFLDRMGTVDPETTEPSDEERDIHFTNSGRKVYGGGGITPDYVVPSERASALLSRMIRQNMIFDYGVRYADSHSDLDAEFSLGDEALDEFREFLRSREFRFTDEEFAADRENIKRRIEASVARVKWGEAAESRVLAAGDAQIRKALTLFEEATHLPLDAS